MELLTRVESHAQDLFKLQDASGSSSRDRRSFPKLAKPPRAGAAASADDASVSSDSSPPLPAARRMAKSKSLVNVPTLAGIPEENAVPGSAGDDAPSRPMRKEASWLTLRSLTSEDVSKIHYEDLFACATRNFGKGFVLGFFGRMSLNAFFELVGIMRRRGLPTDGASLVQLTVDGAKEHGIFLGLLLSVYNSFNYATRNAPMPYARYRGAAAGALAGLSSLWALPASMRRSALLFLSVRAFELACRVAARRGTFPTLKNGDTYLMSGASALMIYQWMFFPGVLDAAYVHFLQRQVQFNTTVVRCVAAMQLGQPLDVDAVNKTRALFRPPPAPVSDPLVYDKLPTALDKAAFILHPTQSFAAFAGRYFLEGLRNALPVYLPVYVLPMLLFSHKRLRKHPAETLLATAQGIARSTVFLATYCTLGITSISLFRRMGLRHDAVGAWAQLSIPLSGALAGLATLLEKKHRRIELALYVMQRALDGLHNMARNRFGPRVASPAMGDSALFAALLAVIMHAHLRHSDLVRPAYRSFLARFFDSEERHVFL